MSVITQSPQEFVQKLSKRQLTIATYIAHGYSNKYISRRLGVKISTISNCLSMIYLKLQITAEYNPRSVLIRMITLYEVGNWEIPD